MLDEEFHHKGYMKEALTYFIPYIFKKHQMLTVFFRHIAKVSNDIAQADACRIEHVISDETMQGIEQYLKENSLI